MVAHTDITQECYSVTLNPDTQEHRIETSVTEAGELPSTAIFVYTIGIEEELSTDSFSRVGNPQDIQNLKINRDDAIAAGDTEYLASFLELTYSDLDIAVQAKATLRTRINELIRAWLTYRDEFTVDSGVNLPFPTADPDVEEALIEAYVEARAARITAEANVTTKEEEVEDAEAAVTNAQEIHTIYDDSLSHDIQLNTELGTYNGLILTPGTEADNYWTHTVLDTLQNWTNNLVAKELTWRNTVTARKTAYEEAVLAKAQADQELAAAQAAENAALAAVLEVNPDFDSSSV